MTDEQIRDNLAPHGNVKVLHPLKGSEDDRPELTREQKDTLDEFIFHHDEVAVSRLLPNGSAQVEVTDYDDDEQTSFTTRVIEVTPGGVPF